MPRALYGPQPPRLIPQPDGSELPAAPNGGTLSTFDAATMELAALSGAAQDLCTVAILPARVTQLECFIDGYDPSAGVRVATGFSVVSAVRRGTGVVTLFGSPVFLTYDPNTAPWNTVTADVVVAASGTDVVWRTSSPNIGVRWRAQIRVVGAQAQVLT